MKDIAAHQNILNQHFNNIACSYNDYRTLDRAPVEYITDIVGTDTQAICNLGCGTGRYLVALMESLESAEIPTGQSMEWI